MLSTLITFSNLNFHRLDVLNSMAIARTTCAHRILSPNNQLNTHKYEKKKKTRSVWVFVELCVIARPGHWSFSTVRLLTKRASSLKDMARVLKSTKELLDLIGLGNETVIIFNRKMSKTNIVAIVVTSQISFFIPSTLFILNNTNILSRINNPIHIIIGILIMILIYLDLFRNQTLINQTFNSLEETIASSEYTYVVMHFSHAFFQ